MTTIADKIDTDLAGWLRLHAQAVANHDIDAITEAAGELDHLLRLPVEYVVVDCADVVPVVKANRQRQA